MKIRAGWLTQRVEDAPTSFHQDLSPMASLRIRMAWQKLKRQAAQGDELWAFSNPSDIWRKHGKCSGYALVRDGEILQSTVAMRE